MNGWQGEKMNLKFFRKWIKIDMKRKKKSTPTSKSTMKIKNSKITD